MRTRRCRESVSPTARIHQEQTRRAVSGKQARPEARPISIILDKASEIETTPRAVVERARAFRTHRDRPLAPEGKTPSSRKITMILSICENGSRPRETHSSSSRFFLCESQIEIEIAVSNHSVLADAVGDGPPLSPPPPPRDGRAARV
jgi:hypothetical protein